MFVTDGVPCGVAGRTVLRMWRVGLQVLLTTLLRASVTELTLPTSSMPTFTVRLVGAIVLVNWRRALYWNVVALTLPSVWLVMSPTELFTKLSPPRLLG